MAKQPRYIAGIINQYHFNERARDQGVAISRIETLYAKRHWFSGTWSVHELTINTGKPVTGKTRLDRNILVNAALAFKPRCFNIANDRSSLSGEIGNHHEIKSGLTLKEAFNLVRANEENPRQIQFTTSTAEILASCERTGILDLGGKAALKQVRPNTDCYWRNLNPA